MAKVDDVRTFLKTQISLLKRENLEMQNWPDEKVFAFLCLQHYLADDADSFEDISPSIFEWNGKYFSICNNAKGGTKNVSVAFFDYNVETMIESDFWQFPLKITRDIESFSSAGIRFSQDLAPMKAYFDSCIEEAGNNPQVSLFYFTGITPSKDVTKRNANAMLRTKIKELSSNIVLEDIRFGWEIKSWITSAQTGDGRIDFGSLKIDRPGNVLNYMLGEEECAVIVNISAHSLRRLYDEHGKNLLGLNLRYHVRGKNVDDGIKNTINEHPEWFWCLNNGMVLICDEFHIENDVVNLKSFSIVNGGQTTTQVANIRNDSPDFFIMCKIVKTGGVLETLSPDKIAVASNAQKPIKPKDLAANGEEQMQLKAWFLQRNWQYVIKQGEKIEFKDKKVSLDNLGKIVMASLLQMPWTRSDATKMLYDREKPYYQWIYGGAKRPPCVALYPSLIELNEHYSKRFIKRADLKEVARMGNVSIPSNARTFALAAVVYIAFYFQNGYQAPAALEMFQRVEGREYSSSVFSKIFEDGVFRLKSVFQGDFDLSQKNLFERFFITLSNDVFYSAYTQSGSTDVSGFFKNPKSYIECLGILNPLLRDPHSGVYKVGKELFE